jgi:predicted enzyme related to lactoylglutathione lyase
MQNAINWFEIPVVNMTRAKVFYGTVLDVSELSTQPFGNGQMTVLPYSDGVGGALVENKEQGYTPSQQGAVIYLNGGENLSTPLSKVEAAGGKVLVDKMAIGENGFIAFFLDTEGNKVGFHSMN